MSRLPSHEQKQQLRVSEAECGETRTLGFHREGRGIIASLDSNRLSPTKNQSLVLENTIAIYRDMVRRLISIVNLRWKEIAVCETKQRYVERLFHATKDNSNPKFSKFFGLGTKLYKFPSYLRRAAINDAIGHVSSFHSRYYDWQGGIRKKRTAKPPRLNTTCGVYPDLYKNQCIKIASDYSQAEIKVYKNSDWQWETVIINSLSRRHLIPNVKQLSPTLVVKNGNVSLSVPYQIPNTKNKPSHKYCGVDLGYLIQEINNKQQQQRSVFFMQCNYKLLQKLVYIA